MNFVYHFRDRIPKENYCEIRYEDLLTHPEEIMRELVNFAEISIEDKVITEACKSVNISRLDNSKYYLTFEKEIQSLPYSKLMDRLNYTIKVIKWLYIEPEDVILCYTLHYG